MTLQHIQQIKLNETIFTHVSKQIGVNASGDIIYTQVPVYLKGYIDIETLIDSDFNTVPQQGLYKISFKVIPYIADEELNTSLQEFQLSVSNLYTNLILNNISIVREIKSINNTYTLFNKGFTTLWACEINQTNSGELIPFTGYVTINYETISPLSFKTPAQTFLSTVQYTGPHKPGHIRIVKRNIRSWDIVWGDVPNCTYRIILSKYDSSKDSWDTTQYIDCDTNVYTLNTYGTPAGSKYRIQVSAKDSMNKYSEYVTAELHFMYNTFLNVDGVFKEAIPYIKTDLGWRPAYMYSKTYSNDTVSWNTPVLISGESFGTPASTL